MNEIKRLQQLAGINEIKINKPIFYKIRDKYIPYLHQDYDDVRYDIGEDKADCFYYLNDVDMPFNKEKLNNHLEKYFKDSWEGDVDSLINFCIEQDIIEKI